MKAILSVTLFIVLLSFSCKKKNEPADCTGVTITQTGTLCSNWGIRVNGIIYQSLNIPDEFKVEGRYVCASWELYDDMRFCGCCGGTWANIKSMKNFIR